MRSKRLLKALAALLAFFLGYLIVVNINDKAADSPDLSDAAFDSSINDEKTDADVDPAALLVLPSDSLVEESYYLDKRIPGDLREAVIANREETFSKALNPDLERYQTFLTPGYNESEDDAVVSVLQGVLPEDTKVGEITRGDAVNEIIFLTDYLKYFYGGYEFFGGDRIFHAIRDEITAELERMDNPVKVNDYKQLVVNNLRPVIFDRHFSFGNIQITSNENLDAQFLVSEAYLFTKQDHQYVTKDGQYEFISASLDERDIGLLPYLDGGGEFVWVLGFLHNSVTPVEISAEFRNLLTGEKEYIKIELKPPGGLLDTGNGFYHVDERDGVKIAISRRLSLYGSEKDEERRAFMSAQGKALQNEQAIIMDLRQNGGGNSGYGAAWIKGFLDLEQYGFQYGLSNNRLTKTVVFVSPYVGFESVGEFEDALRKRNGTGEFTGWFDVVYEPDGRYDNKDTLLIVLVDASTGSAAEFFTAMLKQIDNTIVIGTNTGGVITFGNAREITLPYSKMPLRCGHGLTLQPDGTSIEGVGMSPDIWAPPGEALNRALLFIDNYNLNQ